MGAKTDSHLIFISHFSMRKHFFLASIIFLSMLSANAQLANNQSAAVSFKWYTAEQAYNANLKAPKKVFIDVYTDWCGWCKKMDATTFRHPIIQDILSTYYYYVKFNAESTTPIKLGENTFTNTLDAGGRGTHQFAAGLLQNQMSYPSFAFLDETWSLITPVPGYRTAKDLETILMWFASNSYKKISYDQYVATFKGRVTE